MMKLMPPEMSHVNTPARTRWAAAGSAEGLRLTDRSYARSRASCQVAAEALDAPASFLHVLGLGGVGNAERGTETERRTLHHRHDLGLQQLGDEVLVGDELMAARRGPAHGAGARRVDIERALGLGALDAARLIEHRDAEVAPLLEDSVVLGDEVLRSVERLDRRPLRHRRWV